MTEENYCYEQIRRLQEEYRLLAKPYVDRLVAIQAMRVRPTFTADLTPEQRASFTVRIADIGRFTEKT